MHRNCNNVVFNTGMIYHKVVFIKKQKKGQNEKNL